MLKTVLLDEKLENMDVLSVTVFTTFREQHSGWNLFKQIVVKRKLNVWSFLFERFFSGEIDALSAVL